MAPTKTDFSTPDIPQREAVLLASARTLINAPASLVFRTLRNTETWKDWNRWCPRVTVTDQPDDEDDATLAEIEELVRNTSIAVNFDSDITDGAAQPTSEHSDAYRRASGEMDANGTSATGQRKSTSGRGGLGSPNSPPAVTRQRLASNASRISGSSFDGGTRRNNSTGIAMPNGSDNPPPARRASAAQMYQAATEGARRGSLPGSVITPPQDGTDSPSTGGGVLLAAPNNTSLLMPAPPNTQSTALARRKSSTSGKTRRQLHINALYGEPSVRLQLGTKMTLYQKMKIPSSQELTERAMLVTEVSRPEDPLENEFSPAQLDNALIMRTQTHTETLSGVYRLVWTSVSSYNPPKSYPKFVLFTQRVHEIRPTVDGAGQEICEYWDWECQKGMMAKKSAKGPQGKQYMEARMAEWGRRLGEFCESMGGAVERRDFVG